MDNDISFIVDSITKALGYAENGGAPNLSNPSQGQTGELKSIFQFTPDTWKKDAKQILGNENAQLTPDNETYVVQQKVKNWVTGGYTARQIASMWNAGEGEPNAYTGTFSNGKSSIGINKKYNVKFDVPSYADKVQKYSVQFYKEKQQKSTLASQANQQSIP